MNILGMVLICIVPILFYTLVFACMKTAGLIEEILSFKKKEIVGTLFVLACSAVFLYAVLKPNRFIYYWDFGQTWVPAVSLLDLMLTDPIQALKTIYETINNSDYNWLMPTLELLPMKLFGYTYKYHVFLHHVFYMCPASLIVALYIKKVLKKINNKIQVNLSLIVFLFLTAPILIEVEYDGFIDGPMLILVVCCLLLVCDYDYSRINYRKNILLSICLLLLAICRRHFAYWVVGFIISVLVSCVIYCIESKKPEGFGTFILNMEMVGIPDLLILALFFRPYLIRSFFSNYSAAYSAYSLSLGGSVQRHVEVFGIVILAMAFAVPINLSIRNRGMRDFMLPTMANIWIATLMIWKTMSMNYHHYYLIIVQTMALVIVSFYVLCYQINKFKMLRYIATAVACAFGIMNMGISAIPAMRNIPLKQLFTTHYFSPLIRNDMAEINTIIADLKSIREENPALTAYVLASSGILNDDILRMAQYPEQKTMSSQLYTSYHVDLRDGFDPKLLNADIVLVCDPIQTHLPDGTQRIITYPAELILNPDSYIGEHFKLYKQYSLDNGVTANMYIKCSPFDEEDYVQLAAYYDQYYSDYPDLFRNRIYAAIGG